MAHLMAGKDPSPEATERIFLGWVALHLAKTDKGKDTKGYVQIIHTRFRAMEKEAQDRLSYLLP